MLGFASANHAFFGENTHFRGALGAHVIHIFYVISSRKVIVLKNLLHPNHHTRISILSVTVITTVSTHLLCPISSDMNSKPQLHFLTEQFYKVSSVKSKYPFFLSKCFCWVHILYIFPPNQFPCYILLQFNYVNFDN